MDDLAWEDCKKCMNEKPIVVIDSAELQSIELLWYWAELQSSKLQLQVQVNILNSCCIFPYYN